MQRPGGRRAQGPARAGRPDRPFCNPSRPPHAPRGRRRRTPWWRGCWQWQPWWGGGEGGRGWRVWGRGAAAADGAPTTGWWGKADALQKREEAVERQPTPASTLWHASGPSGGTRGGGRGGGRAGTAADRRSPRARAERRCAAPFWPPPPVMRALCVCAARGSRRALWRGAGVCAQAEKKGLAAAPAPATHPPPPHRPPPMHRARLAPGPGPPAGRLAGGRPARRARAAAAPRGDRAKLLAAENALLADTLKVAEAANAALEGGLQVSGGGAESGRGGGTRPRAAAGARLARLPLSAGRTLDRWGAGGSGSGRAGLRARAAAASAPPTTTARRPRRPPPSPAHNPHRPPASTRRPRKRPPKRPPPLPLPRTRSPRGPRRPPPPLRASWTIPPAPSPPSPTTTAPPA
jgi:hypothetical protein